MRSAAKVRFVNWLKSKLRIRISVDPIDLTFEKQADGSMLLVEAAIAANHDEAL